MAAARIMFVLMVHICGDGQPPCRDVEIQSYQVEKHCLFARQLYLLDGMQARCIVRVIE